MSGNLGKIVKKNSAVLSTCTAVNPEMISCLIQDGLITRSEKNKITSANSDHDRATILYDISAKWADGDFENFLEALKEGGNRKALETLKQDLQIEKHSKINTSVEQLGVEVKLPVVELADLQISMDSRTDEVELRAPGPGLTGLELAVGALKVWVSPQSNMTMQFDGEVCELRSSTGESLVRIQVDSKKVETPLASNEWDLTELRTFEVKQAEGSWFWIERFHRSSHFTLPATCEKYVFSLMGTTISVINRFMDGIEEKEIKFDMTVDTESTYQWINSDGAVWRWLKTDYANWGLLKWCNNKDHSSGDTLFIVSRTESLSQETLNILRKEAEKHGFQRAKGLYIQQTTCK